MTTKISIVHIEDYKNLQEAIIKGIELIEDDFKFNLHELSNILLKPNLLRATEDACTQPSFVDGVLSYLTKKGIDMENVS
ncbi:MAG: hypothetical protein ACTSR5_16245, partial [Promethearchaeota archaeon]